MKKLLWTIFVLTLCIKAQSQDTAISYIKIDTINSVKATELFLRARAWVNKEFISLRSVTQISDKETGEISLKAIFSVPMHYIGMGMNAKSTTEVHFSLDIIIKDERYKCAFTDFDATEFGLLTSAENTKVSWPMLRKKVVKKMWDEVKENTIQKAKDMCVNLNLSMHKAISDF